MTVIPRHLLRQSCTLRSYDLTRGTYSDTLLTRVRLELKGRRGRRIAKWERDTCGILYYDCRISRPEDIELMEPDTEKLIICNGACMEIKRVSCFYDETGLHHIEAELAESSV